MTERYLKRSATIHPANDQVDFAPLRTTVYLARRWLDDAGQVAGTAPRTIAAIVRDALADQLPPGLYFIAIDGQRREIPFRQLAHTPVHSPTKQAPTTPKIVSH